MEDKMGSELPEMKLQAIGTVRSEFNNPHRREDGEKTDFDQLVSEIIIDPELSEALDGLDGFSHIIVLYWIHRHHPGKAPTRVHPRGNRAKPLTGLFATRSPHRPNPLGKATVRLLRRQENRLTVEGLDAIDGTPVLDIKPYIPGYDSAEDARVPSWMTQP
jgi:tRNA-Thr(GGU) m(6)t(6)A37 methyltransferase TsaA